jgi:glycosyltransferase involved in cell wall biosynthesis
MANQTDKALHNHRHCMVVHAYYPLGETRVEREAHALIDQGCEVDVICLKRAGDVSKETINGVGIYRMPVSRHKKSGRFVQLLEYLAFFFLAAIKLSSLYVGKRYDSVQAHNLPDFLVFSAIIPKIFGAKVILDIHDMMPDFYAASIDGDFNSFPVKLISWEERISCRFADHVICVTENARQSIIDRGVAPNKVSIVMNVADSKIFFRLPGDDYPSRIEDEFRLVYHGTMTKRYGVDLLIKAIAQVRNEIPGIQLMLIGGGELRDELMTMCEKLDLADHIFFAPNVVLAADLPEMLRECNVGVVPNLNDSFTNGLLPTKLMEFTALGIPVIAAETTTISSYFDDNMVLFFEPGNLDELCAKIIESHRNPDLRKNLIENSNKFNEEYSWGKISAEYVALIDRLNGD